MLLCHSTVNLSTVTEMEQPFFTISIYFRFLALLSSICLSATISLLQSTSISTSPSFISLCSLSFLPQQSLGLCPRYTLLSRHWAAAADPGTDQGQRGPGTLSIISSLRTLCLMGHNSLHFCRCRQETHVFLLRL